MLNCPEATWAVVTPVFEDGRSFAQLCRDLSRNECELEIIAVDDGSLLDPPAIGALEQLGLVGKIIRLKRNVGHQGAIAVGLACTAAEKRYAGVVVMDCDGEDQPEHVIRLIQALGPDCDAVVAHRGQRSESVGFRIFYILYRTLFRLLTGRNIRSGNFCALSCQALSRLTAMQETRLHLAAALVKSKLGLRAIRSDRGKRYAGRSQMNFIALAVHGIRAIAVFDDAVLMRVGAACVGTAAAGGLVFSAAAILKISGLATPGWLTTVTGFLLLILLQTGVFSVIALMINRLGPLSPAEISTAVLSLILGTESTRQK